MIVTGIVLGFSLQLVKAWVSAPGDPSTNNVGAPINTGPQNQTKLGGLTVTALATGGFRMTNGACDKCVLTSDSEGNAVWRPSQNRIIPPGSNCIKPDGSYGKIAVQSRTSDNGNIMNSGDYGAVGLVTHVVNMNVDDLLWIRTLDGYNRPNQCGVYSGLKWTCNGNIANPSGRTLCMNADGASYGIPSFAMQWGSTGCMDMAPASANISGSNLNPGTWSQWSWYYAGAGSMNWNCE